MPLELLVVADLLGRVLDLRLAAAFELVADFFAGVATLNLLSAVNKTSMSVHTSIIDLMAPARSTCPPGGDAGSDLSMAITITGGAQRKMLTARAATRRTVRQEMADSLSMSSLAQRLSGIASVGLKAIELVKET